VPNMTTKTVFYSRQVWRCLPFKIVDPVQQGNVFHDMLASLRIHFLANPKPRLLLKQLGIYRIEDTEICVILTRTSYHRPWNCHLVTPRQGPCRSFPKQRPRFASGQHVGFVVDKKALGQVSSEYFGFPCQSSFHQFLQHHNHSGLAQ
jgi:hypothetical protein